MIATPEHVPPHLVLDFDIYAPEGAEQDYFAPFRRLYEIDAPDLFWTPRYGGHWVMRRSGHLSEAFADYGRFSSLAGVVPRENSPPPDRRVLPIQSDPPEHTVFRQMIAPAFAPGAVARREDEVRRLAVTLIEGLQPRGQCEFVSDLGLHLPIKVFMSMVDLPESDRLMLIELVTPLFEGASTEKMRVMGAIQQYLAPIVAKRRADPGTDLISQITRKKVGERDITTDEVLRLCTVLMLGGLDTVASMMGFVIHFLATHPGHRRQLLDRRESIPTAVDELLRRFAMTNPGRIVARDLEFHGVTMRQGDMVMMATPSGAIDPARFDEPDKVRFGRETPEHTTFGKGPHRCPGAYLARAELKVLLEEWLPRIPEFRLRQNDPPVVRTGINGRFAKLSLEW